MLSVNSPVADLTYRRKVLAIGFMDLFLEIGVMTFLMCVMIALMCNYILPWYNWMRMSFILLCLGVQLYAATKLIHSTDIHKPPSELETKAKFWIVVNIILLAFSFGMCFIHGDWMPFIVDIFIRSIFIHFVLKYINELEQLIVVQQEDQEKSKAVKRVFPSQKRTSDLESISEV